MRLSEKICKITVAHILSVMIGTTISIPVAWAGGGNDLVVPIIISGPILQIEKINELLVLRAEKLYVVDISRPANPFVLGFLGVGPTWEIAVWGDCVFALTTKNELVAVDISDPENPKPKGVLPIPGDVIGIDTAGGLAYLVCRDSKLIIVDIQTPSIMEIVSITETPKAALWIDELDGVVYLAGRFSVWAYNVTSPENPLLIDSINLRELVGGLKGIIAREDYIYILMRGYIAVLANETPNGFNLIYSEDGASVFTQFNFDFKGHIACVAWGVGGAGLTDYTNPALPLQLGRVPLDGCEGGVCFVGDHIYIGDHQGLNVIDASKNTDPKKIGLLKKEIDVDELVLVKLLNEGFMTYSEARVIVINLGWEPFAFSGDCELFEHHREYLDRGWIECQFCSPTGLGICDFEFRKPGTGKSLVLSTASIIEREAGIPILYQWYIVK